MMLNVFMMANGCGAVGITVTGDFKFKGLNQPLLPPVKIVGRGVQLFGATTLSITTYSIMTLSVKGLFATPSIMTFSINETQHNSTLCAIMLNVAFYSLLC
jgi:hypothetical protein